MHCPWANDLPFPKDPQNKVEVDDWETLEDPHAKHHPKSSAEPKPKHKGNVKDYSFQLPVRRRLMRKKYQVDVYDYFNWSPISFGVLSKYPFRLWCRMKGTTFRVSSPFWPVALRSNSWPINYLLWYHNWICFCCSVASLRTGWNCPCLKDCQNKSGSRRTKCEKRCLKRC